MNIGLVKGESLDGLNKARRSLDADMLNAMQVAIDMVCVFMQQRHCKYESYIKHSLKYFKANFSSFGEDGLLVIAGHFHQDINLLQAIVESKLIVNPEKIILLAKISLFSEEVCEEIIDTYEDESIAEGLVREMMRLRVDTCLKIVTKAIKMAYVSVAVMRRLSTPFINYREVSSVVASRTIVLLQDIVPEKSECMMFHI